MRRYSSLTLVVLLVISLVGCLHHRSRSVATGSRPTVTGLVPIDSGPSTPIPVEVADSPAALSDYVRAVLKISQENTAAAEQALKQFHQSHPDLAQLSRRVTTSPTDIESRRVLGEAYLEAGLLPFAYQMYQEIESVKPGTASAEIGIASVWDRWGDYGQAAQHAERAVLLEPLSASALEALGRIYLHRNDLDSALSSFLSAVRIEPKNSSLLTNTGYVLLRRGDFLQARLYLEEAVAIDNSSVEAHNNLGIALARLGESDRALREFMAVSDASTAFNNLGAVLLEQKKWTEAKGAFQRALVIDPNYEKARTNLAEAETHIPRPTVVDLPPFKLAGDVAASLKREAQKPVARTAEAGGRTKLARIKVAYLDASARFRAKRYREALDIFQWLLLQEPTDEMASNCQYLIGESYFALRDLNQARTAFKRVLQYTNSPRRTDAAVMLKRVTAKQRLGKRTVKA